ncbi:helix-turn-helix domain-containing protein [Streptomyces sp. QTS52]
MIRTVFDSTDFPVGERFDRWRDTVRLSLVPTVVSVDDPDGFRATMSHLDLGTVQLASMALSPLRSSRTSRMIRSNDPEKYSVALVLGGEQYIRQAGHESVAGAYDLVFYDSSHPCDALVASGVPTPARTVVAQFSKSLLPPRVFDRLLGARLSGREGVGAVLAQILIGLADGTVGHRPSDSCRVAGILIDLLAVTLAQELDADADVPPETHQHALSLRVLAYIEQHLADPDLSPGVIAAAHQVSVRQLYRIFQQQGTSVAAWIRRQRLARCRHDLTDPLLRPRTVHSIAARYGFGDAAHFSRAFRAAYGMSPSEWREHARPSTRV